VTIESFPGKALTIERFLRKALEDRMVIGKSWNDEWFSRKNETNKRYLEAQEESSEFRKKAW